MRRHAAFLVLFLPGIVRGDADADKKQKLHVFVGWAESAVSDYEKANGPPDADIFKWCIKSYDDAVAAGVSPSETVTVRKVTGTIEEIKTKYCTGGKATFDDAKAKREAPFRKVLKNDKLAMALKDADAIVLPGGSGTDDPQKLAAAPVWYIDTSPPERCPDGRQRHRVHKYVFDGNHKLKSSTDQDYCGSPPSSAYR